jgi:hypothetical protein
LIPGTGSTSAAIWPAGIAVSEMQKKERLIFVLAGGGRRNKLDRLSPDEKLN